MKAIPFYIACFFILLQTQCKGQAHTANNHSGQVSVRLSLRQYKIDTCLSDLLYSIVNLDSNHLRYPSAFYYYMLQFEEATNYKRITILPKRWSKHLPRDCSGIIQMNGMSFLCCGNLKKSFLFTDMGVGLSKDIHVKELYDSLDVQKEKGLLDWENSPTALVGSYKLCQGSPIDLYINVGSQLQGVEIKK